ncbi:GNAT family N-acetyltransferase [Paenibacillus soyae]|uniref:GNAT family N-acetyltransferase n=1 Tax=Paenibacillus soyae TaxID=2969249 RepID=A0A9X2N0Y8_9BACL|nr:GNAT family N-acetyltransferase [Paenibacillus soyae]MCR2807087.1 GNAT family N-acetyltransferase [Paenibacillus soyae]
MLIGKLVNLRLIQEEDLPELVVLMNDLEHRSEHLGVELHHERKLQSYYAEAGYWEADFGRMLIVDKSGRMLGAITFFKATGDSEGYEIGYQIYRKDDRGKGYGTEALRLFSSYVFELKPIQRLQICTAKENAAARRIAEKCGFVYEGTMRRAVFARGRYIDLDFLSMLRDECTPLSEVLAAE